MVAGGLRLLLGKPPRQKPAIVSGVLVGVVVAATSSYVLGGLSVIVGLCAALAIQYAVGQFLRGDESEPDR